MHMLKAGASTGDVVLKGAILKPDCPCYDHCKMEMMIFLSVGLNIYLDGIIPVEQAPSTRQCL